MIFYYFGEYLLLLKKVFKRPEKWRVYWKQILYEMNDIGVGSLGLILIISTFIGAVMTMQIAYQLDSGFIPNSVIRANQPRFQYSRVGAYNLGVSAYG